jgi:acyl dehydratase
MAAKSADLFSIGARMPLNQACIGKPYVAASAEVTLDGLQQYAYACSEENPHYFDRAVSGGILAPPMFNTTLTWAALLNAITDPALQADLLRLLHVAQDMEFLAPLRPGDTIAASARIVSIEPGSGGGRIMIQLDAANQDQALVSRSFFTAVIRGRLPERMNRSHSPATTSRSDPILTLSQTVDHDQAVRYAAASGDSNPIHLDEQAARIAGLPGVVVHGLCTMALTAKLMVDHLCDGQPQRLKRLAVHFSRPVFPGDTIATTIWREPDRGRMLLGFETRNQAGQAVITGGVAEIAV